MELTFISHSLPFLHQSSFNNNRTSLTERPSSNELNPSSSSSSYKRSVLYCCSTNKNNTENEENGRKDKEEEYKQAEWIQESQQEVSMTVWNEVIHASLKRKLQGLVAEKPVTNGVSALLYTSPATTATTTSSSSSSNRSNMSSSTSLISSSIMEESNAKKRNPIEVVEYLLSSFKKDALYGATAFVSVASDNCHVKYTQPETLVLFIGDNDSYRPLLRLTSFYLKSPRFESSGNKCVIHVEIHLPNVGKDDTANFDFQLSNDPTTGFWLIDEVFRL